MKMKLYSKALTIAASVLALSGCTDMDEKVYDRIDASIYYQNETSVKGAVAAIYSKAALSYIEYFWYLQEFPADQVTWRVWNGGQWGYDEGEKTVLSTHTWTPDSKIIRSTWETAWTTIGLCNTLLADLQELSPAAVGITDDNLQSYIAEVRTLRAWAYYNVFEIWGGTLPLNVDVTTDVPGSASTDFDEGCQIIYNFISDELDEACPYLSDNTGAKSVVNRMNKCANRMIKMRLLLNSEVFVKQDKYSECAALAQEIIDGKYGNYSLADDYRDIFGIDNNQCPEVVMAFAMENGQLNGGWMRNMPFLPYNYDLYFGGSYSQSGWNCCCLTPSWDNSGNVNTYGGTDSPKSFLTDYGDKLGAVYERFDNRDVRKHNFTYNEATGEWSGMFIKGAVKTLWSTGDEFLTADADRDGQALYYVDQVGQFMNQGRTLEDVMSPRWGETNSGVRLVKYPIYPESAGIDFQDIDEVEFRLSEVYYTLAECKMRSGDATAAKALVDQVRTRYFTDKSALDTPGTGFTAFDNDWMLSQWGLEFLCEGRRRRTDLRRFDKFTQGQWWFFGRTQDDGYAYPAQRDRKYEWYPLPSSALMVNPGLVQNPYYN